LKRLFIAILAFFYLGIASGVMVNVHYCMGQLASVDYGHQAEGGDCGKCGMPDDNNACCHTESTLVKLQDDHQVSGVHFFFKQPEVLPSYTPLYEVKEVFAIASQSYSNIHAPPDGLPHTIYLYNCVFRI
jgi:hypothetical protein